MATIDQNQKTYLDGLVKAGGGNAEWAKAQLASSTVEAAKPTATPSKSLGTAYQNGGLGALAQAGQSYTSPAVNNTKTTTPSYTAPATSYTGSANQIGNVSGSTDLAKSYQDLYNSTRNDTNKYSQQNTWGDSKGNVYDTTSMTPQQIFALSLAKDGNPNAAAILKGMGLDMNGNATSPTPTYSGSNTSSATQKPTYQTGELTPTSSNAADYAAGGKYASYNVNDKAFQDKTEEEKQAIFAANPTLAAQEIQRAKQVWADNPNDPEKQRLAHEWANKVGAWAGLRDKDGNDIETTTPGGSVDPNAGAGAGQNDPGEVDWNDPKAREQYVGGLISKYIKSTTDPDSEYQKKLRADSDLEQQGIFNSKKSQYEQLLSSLKTGQQNDLKAITDGVDSATNKIEDKSFQDWLSARQNAASRGLAGSGIAGDMNTRLLLAKQHDLADMFAGKNAQMADVNKRYSDKINTAESDIANTNLNSMQVAAFHKLLADGRGDMNDQLKTFATLFGELSKQNMTSESDKMKYALEKYKTDSETGFNYAKLNADNQNKVAELQLKWKQYGLDVTKTFGQDENGNLTLDANKLLEQVRSNRASESISSAHNQAMDSVARMNASTNAQNANTRADEVKDMNANRLAQFRLDVDKFKDSHMKDQVDVLYKSAESATKTMDSLVKQKADYMSNNFGSNVDPNVISAYDAKIQEASNNVEDSRNAMLHIKDLNNTDSNSGTNTNPTFQ